MNFPPVSKSASAAQPAATAYGFNSPEFAREHRLRDPIKREFWSAPESQPKQESKAVQTAALHPTFGLLTAALARRPDLIPGDHS